MLSTAFPGIKPGPVAAPGAHRVTCPTVTTRSRVAAPAHSAPHRLQFLRTLRGTERGAQCAGTARLDAAALTSAEARPTSADSSHVPAVRCHAGSRGGRPRSAFRAAPPARAWLAFSPVSSSGCPVWLFVAQMRVSFGFEPCSRAPFRGRPRTFFVRPHVPLNGDRQFAVTNQQGSRH